MDTKTDQSAGKCPVMHTTAVAKSNRDYVPANERVLWKKCGLPERWRHEALSVRLAMIQLYILFMVTPLFFLLGQVDRHAIEAARDLGGNWFSVFKEIILPQTMPGIVIGSIFIFVLTMGEYGTVSVIGQGAVSSVGTFIDNQILGIQYPQGAASAVLLVFVLILGVFGITRFANLREEL